MTNYLDLLNDPRIVALKEGDTILIRLTAPPPPRQPKPDLVIVGGRDVKPPEGAA